MANGPLNFTFSSLLYKTDEPVTPKKNLFLSHDTIDFSNTVI